MPRVCSVCSHVDRDAIDAALVAGASLRNVAERFGLSTTAVHRHKRDHLPGALVAAKEAHDVAHADDLLAQAKDLHARSLAILERAEKADRLPVALSAIREARGCVELYARLLSAAMQEAAAAEEARRRELEASGLADVTEQELEDEVDRLVREYADMGRPPESARVEDLPPDFRAGWTERGGDGNSAKP